MMFKMLGTRLIIFLRKPEGFFVFSGLFFGIIFIIIVPPFQTPDENTHFYRAYEVSELELPHKISTGETGSYLPLSIAQTQAAVHGVYAPPNTPGHIMFNVNEKYSYHYTKAALFDIPLNKKVRIFYSTASAPAYMPLSYLPQGIVVAAARLFNFPIIVMLYMVRAINLLIWLLLACFGIKLFPWKKWALVGICLLPMVVSQSISPGLDVSIFGASFLFIAIIFKTLSDREYTIGYKRLLLLLVVALIMVFGKSVLVIFLPLIFLVKKKQIGFKYAYIMRVLIILVPVALYFLWAVLSVNQGSATDQSGSALQTHLLFSNPIIFISSLFNTFMFITPSGDILAQSIVGNFGWLDTPLAPTFVTIGYVFLSLILLVNYEPVEKTQAMTRRIRFTLTTISLLYVGSVFLAMYLYFTSVGENHIRGVNGRYFVPLLILAVPTLFFNTVKMEKKVYKNTVKWVSIFLLIASVVTILFRYYFSFIPR